MDYVFLPKRMLGRLFMRRGKGGGMSDHHLSELNN